MDEPDESRDDGHGRGLLASCLLITAYAVWRGPLLLPHCDAWWHVAQVRESVSQGGWLVRQADGSILPSSGLWHTVVAALSRLLAMEPLPLWFVISALLAPAMVLSAALLSRTLLGPRLELAGIWSFFILFEGTHLDPWRQLAYPRYVNWILFMLALAMAVRYARSGARRHLAVAAAIATAMAPIHLVELPLFGLLIGFWVVATLGVHRPAPLRAALRVLAVGALFVALTLPYLVLVVRKSQGGLVPPAIGRTIEDARLRETLHLTDRLFILDPTGEYGRIATGAGLVCLLLCPLLVARSRSDPAIALLFGATLGPPLIVFNPVALPLFLRYWPAPEVLHRLALVSLVPWVVVLIGDALVARWRDATRRRDRLLAAAGVGLLLISLGPSLRLRLSVARPISEGGGSPATPRRLWGDELALTAGWLDAFVELDLRFGQRVVVLTDPLTANLLQAWTKHEGIAASTAFDADHARRPLLPQFRLFRDPCQSTREVAELLDATRARVVMVNRRKAPPAYEMTELRDTFYSEDSAALLRRNPAWFRPFYDRDGVVMAEVIAGPRPPLEGKDVPVIQRLASLDPAPKEPGRWVPAGLELEAFAPAARPAWSARAGGRLDLAVSWRVPAAHATPVAVTIHLVHREAPFAGWPAPFSKLGRKLFELVTGRRYRAGGTGDLLPEELEGIVAPVPFTLKQHVALSLPSGSQRGEWDVRVRVRPKSAPARSGLALPDDTPPGVWIGTLSVEVP